MWADSTVHYIATRERYIREPERVRTRVNELRTERSIESHKDGIERQIEEIERRKDNILKMAEVAMDEDSIATLQKRLSELERERRDLHSMLVKTGQEEFMVSGTGNSCGDALRRGAGRQNDGNACTETPLNPYSLIS